MRMINTHNRQCWNCGILLRGSSNCGWFIKFYGRKICRSCAGVLVVRGWLTCDTSDKHYRFAYLDGSIIRVRIAGYDLSANVLTWQAHKNLLLAYRNAEYRIPAEPENLLECFQHRKSKILNRSV